MGEPRHLGRRRLAVAGAAQRLRASRPRPCHYRRDRRLQARRSVPILDGHVALGGWRSPRPATPPEATTPGGALGVIDTRSIAWPDPPRGRVHRVNVRDRWGRRRLRLRSATSIHVHETSTKILTLPAWIHASTPSTVTPRFSRLMHRCLPSLPAPAHCYKVNALNHEDQASKARHRMLWAVSGYRGLALAGRARRLRVLSGPSPTPRHPRPSSPSAVAQRYSKPTAPDGRLFVAARRSGPSVFPPSQQRTTDPL